MTQERDGQFINAYVDYASRITDAPKIFHSYVALTIAGAALGNRVLIPSWGDNITPAIWTMLLAPSGFYRKSTAVGIGEAILTEAMENVRLPNEFSTEKLVNTLAANPSGVFVAKEFGTMLSMFRRDYMAGSRDLLTEFFDSEPEYKRELQKTTVTIRRPAVSWLAATTLDWLEERMSMRDWSGGFYARWLYVVGREKEKRLMKPAPIDYAVRRSLVDWLYDLSQIGRVQPVTADLEAVEARFQSWLEEYEDKVNERRPDPALMGMFARTGIYVLKLATIAHFCHTTENAYICTRDLEFALKMVEASQLEIEKVVDEDVTRGDSDAALRRILSKVPTAGWVEHHDLLKASKMKAREFHQFIETLIETEDIERQEYKTAGRTGVRYRRRPLEGEE